MLKKMLEYMKENLSLNCINICVYIIIMIVGMALSGYVVIIDRPSTFWIINLIGFSLYFASYMLINKPKNYKIMYIGLAYIIVSLITLFLHFGHLLDNLKSIGLNINIFVVGINIFFVLDSFRNVELTEKDLNFIGILIFSIGLLSSAYNLLCGGFSLNKIQNNLNNIYEANTSSFFDNKNTFGIFTYFSLVSGIYLFFNCKHKMLTCFGLAVQVFTLIITFCRSALLATGVFGIVFIILLIIDRKILISEKNRRPLIFLSWSIAIICIGILISTAFSSDIRKFIFDAVLRVDMGNTGRTEIWKESIDNFNKTPLNFILGIGYSELNSYGNSYLHNAYLEIFVTGGIVKCLFYILVISIGAKKLFVSKDSNLIKDISKAVFISYFAFANYESQILFELGITPFLFVLFMYILPNRIEEKSEFTC